MSQTTRKEVLQKLQRRYSSAGAQYKRKLLDQAQELLGYHRKAAIRELGAPQIESVRGLPASGRAGRAGSARERLRTRFAYELHLVGRVPGLGTDACR